jgi:hypothetical protein
MTIFLFLWAPIHSEFFFIMFACVYGLVTGCMFSSIFQLVRIHATDLTMMCRDFKQKWILGEDVSSHVLFSSACTSMFMTLGALIGTLVCRYGFAQNTAQDYEKIGFFSAGTSLVATVCFVAYALSIP